MKDIFLESHNINNLFNGFGIFNFHLIKSLSKIADPEIRLTVHAKDIDYLKKEFGDKVKYKKYFSFRRYPNFRIRKKYDVWHCMNQNIKIDPYYDIPYLLTVHNILGVSDPNNQKQVDNVKRFQEKLLRSDAITYISNYAKQSTHDAFEVPDVPEYVIYNGNPVREILLAEDYSPKFIPKKPFLFAIGEVAPRKNFISLVRMLQFLPDYHLVIAGKNDTSSAQEINALAAELKLSDRITLIGRVGDIEKQYYYANCEAFVFPSLREGFGLPLIEAMRFGKPVFTSDNTSLPEVGGDLANYWTHYDPEYMAKIFMDGMEAYRNDQISLSEKLVERSKIFDWDIAARQYLDVYKAM